MAAAKTATLHDLAGEIQRQVIRAKSELDDVRRRLDTLRSERETILSAPMHHTDLASELQRHIEAKAKEAAHFLRASITELRDKSSRYATLSPDEQANFAPFDSRWTPELLAVLTDPETAAARIMAVVGDLDTEGEGLPLEQRRAKVGDLDKQIAAAVETESALVESLAAAGISIPVENPPEAEPQPNEVRVINGKRLKWVTYGHGFGWMPAEAA
jgi:small-conductance mechanosensitive channel